MAGTADEWEDLEERWYIVVQELEAMVQSALVRLGTAENMETVKDIQGEIRAARMLKQLPANKVREFERREGKSNAGRRRRG